jgi:hypothetical protein
MLHLVNEKRFRPFYRHEYRKLYMDGMACDKRLFKSKLKLVQKNSRQSSQTGLQLVTVSLFSFEKISTKLEIQRDTKGFFKRQMLVWFRLK